MFTTKIIPRFKDTDLLGHINNASIVTWFEEARRPIFVLCNPKLDTHDWNLILRKLDVDFLAEGRWQDEVTIETKVGHVGTTSFKLKHEAKQNNKIIATSEEVLVFFNYSKRQKEALPTDIKNKLESHQ